MTDKEQAFINAYLSNGFNGTRAARSAGYEVPESSAYRIKNNPEVKAEIERRMAEFAMGANEVLARMATQARASMEDFLDIPDVDPDYPAAFQNKVSIAVSQARARGQLSAMKKYSADPSTGKVTIELYDAQGALALLGKHHKLWVDKSEVDISTDQISINAVNAVRPETPLNDKRTDGDNTER